MPKKILTDIKIKKKIIKILDKKEEVLPITTTTHKENFINDKVVNNYFENKQEFKKRLHSTPQINSKYNGPNKNIIILFIVIVLLSCIYFISNKFLNANIKIINKHQIFNLENKEFTVSKNGDTPINFEVMIVPTEESKNIILTNTKDVSIKAKGQVTLYNEYSTKSQLLPIHTYLSDTTGKTYLTDKAVSVPGYKIDKKTNKIIPGSIEISVTSFLAGEAYNIDISNFVVNSFKGTTKYKKIYGKSNNAITGGAQGVVYSIADQDKVNLDIYANSSFKNNLIKKATALVPPGYIFYPNAFNFIYKIDNDILSQEPKTSIKISGTLTTLILKESDLSEAVIKSLIPKISDLELNEIKTPDISKLSFKFSNENQIITKDIQSVSFMLNDKFEAIWNPNIETLKLNLTGVNKINIPAIFKKDPGITSASVSIFPPWQSYIPNDINHINIYIQ
jgi:hypothetical protein